jgi:hypothetical protein
MKKSLVFVALCVILIVLVCISILISKSIEQLKEINYKSAWYIIGESNRIICKDCEFNYYTYEPEYCIMCKFGR